MKKTGLSPNRTKTQIVPPGSRKIVLGLLVDRENPRLSREFRYLMRQHLYFLKKSSVGPAKHAKAKGFDSVGGFKNHVFGLATYARQIDKDYGEKCLRALESIDWPI